MLVFVKIYFYSLKDELTYRYSKLQLQIDESSSGGFGESDKYPFNDLFLWAILTKKFAIARLMWQRGRGTLAKALVGGRLCYRMANVAKKKYNTDAVDRLMEETKYAYNTLWFLSINLC